SPARNTARERAGPRTAEATGAERGNAWLSPRMPVLRATLERRQTCGTGFRRHTASAGRGISLPPRHELLASICTSRSWRMAGWLALCEPGTVQPESAVQRFDKEWQADIHSVIDAGMIVRELLVAVGDAKLLESPHKSAVAIQQIELIPFATVDIQCF